MSGATQDLPPAGGFGPIIYQRHLPKRGPPGWLLLAGGFAIILGGLALSAHGFRIRQELEREKRQSRLMILPVLQAEADLRYLRRREESRRLESQIMKDRPDWRVGESVYHGSDTFIPETFLLKDLSK